MNWYSANGRMLIKFRLFSNYKVKTLIGKMFTKKLFVLFAISILTVSCKQKSIPKIPESISVKNITAYSAAENPRYSILLIQEQIFGDTEEIYFRRISRFAVDKKGRVYIPQDSISVFRPDGTYLTSIGKEGSGPGAFETIGSMKIKKNQLFVYDVVLQRLNIFSLDSFSFLRAHSINAMDGMRSWGQFYFRKNGMLIGFKEPGIPGKTRYVHFYEIKLGGKAQPDEIFKKQIKTVIKSKSGLAIWIPPFSRTTLIATLNDGHIYTAWTDEFLIKKYDAQGNYLKAFYYPYQNSPLDLSQFSHDSVSATEIFGKESFPDTWPALNAILTDDKNRLWISTIVGRKQTHEWYILDSEGKLLAKFEWPWNKEIKKVKDGHVYTLEENDKTGVDKIVRYRIEMH